MSRIGNRILSVKDGVEINIAKNNIVTIKGPKGTLNKQLPQKITIIVENQTIKTIRPNEQKHTKQLHGTTNSLLEGMLTGVTTGFSKRLLINGVGYRANIHGDKLNLSLGFSHPIQYTIPEGITVGCPKPTELIISGISKELVGQVAADIRAFRRIEPYKAKGIQYDNEYIIRKEGKSAGK